MIDIHCHILPEMDDGSRSPQESRSLLEISAAQGIGCVVATPHFYAGEDTPAGFLRRRAAARRRLENVLRPGLPEIKLGAEVYWFEGIGRCEELNLLKLEGTRLLLLELPLSRWSRRMLREVLSIQARPETTVVLAHIERYLRWQDAETWDTLLDAGVLNQCNASFFLDWRTRREARKLLRAGRVHFLGSDCHNVSTRSPRLGEALARLDAQEREILRENSRIYLPGWEEMER